MNEEKIFLVTGASGYLASWVCRYLLEAGYSVNGTVRSLNNQEKIAHLLVLQETYSTRFKLFEADLLVRESFHNAMQGCTHIIHTASPFLMKVNNPELDLLRPAVEGTQNVFKTAKEVPTVKKIVVTSSMAAIKGDVKDILDAGGCADETMWNTTSSLSHQAYSYSKTEAEKEAWKISKQQDQWKLVTVNPGFILGPSLSNRIDSTSISFMRDMMKGSMPLLPFIYTELVDVRDVALTHIQAALAEDAKGRYICVNSVKPILHIAKLLNYSHPSKKLPKGYIPKLFVFLFGIFFGFPPKVVKLNYGLAYAVDNSRSINELKVEYRALQNTISEHANQIIDDGLV